MDNLEKVEISKEKKLANGGYGEPGEPGRPGERGELGRNGGGVGGYGGYGGAGGRGGNGNGKNVLASQWIPTIVMILAVFGFWWASADPKARLDKIEANQLDNRKELNEAITSLRKEGVANYVSLREHLDLVARLRTEIELLEKKDDSLMSKAQFDAWKTERDVYIASIIKRIYDLREEILSITKSSDAATDSKLETFIKTSEKTHDIMNRQIDIVHNNIDKVYEKSSTDLRSLAERIDRQDTPLGKRVDVIQQNLEKLRETSASNPVIDSQTHRIDQLYALIREIQGHIFSLQQRDNGRR